MQIKKIQDGEFEGKRVLVRADFNVGIVGGEIQETFKLRACKETVDFLTSKAGTKIALTSHLGRPDGQEKPEFSLAQLQGELEKILHKKIVFVANCIGEQVSQALEKLGDGEVLLLENVRFHADEETNGERFSQQLAENFDVFVNEAFSVCHRKQASVTGITRYLPSYGGLWLQREIENLEKVSKNPQLPAVAIIGGAKIETKLPLINLFEKSYSQILIGGKIANEAADQALQFSQKVVLPVDSAQDRLDIGEKTLEKFCQIIASAKTIVWNGPMGKFEQAPFDKGTRAVLQAVIESGAYTLIGGGESVQVLEENQLMDKISFVSTGGGAMLEYLSGNEMPGITALEVN